MENEFVCWGCYFLIVAEPDRVCAWHFGHNKKEEKKKRRALEKKKKTQMRIHPRVTNKRGVGKLEGLFPRMLGPSGGEE